MTSPTVEIKRAIRQPYAWPGGYPIFFVTDDGGCLCKNCARSEWRNIAQSMIDNVNDGWNVTATEVNWEDTDLFCSNCSDPIESAYGGDNG